MIWSPLAVIKTHKPTILRLRIGHSKRIVGTEDLHFEWCTEAEVAVGRVEFGNRIVCSAGTVAEEYTVVADIAVAESMTLTAGMVVVGAYIAAAAKKSGVSGSGAEVVV